VALVELGATGEREISEHVSHLSPTIGIEAEPIENWFEIELGASTNRSQGATNWELELQFKKPFQLCNMIEVEPGLGSTWSDTTQSDQRPSTWGAEASIGFLFWRTKRIGWFLEPSYGITFGSGTKTSVGLTGGIFFTLP
jgi:hypothetical protein